MTPPAGYEVSLSASSDYGATVVVPGTGVIAATPVYLRLAAGVTAGSYSGNIVCSSAGAANVTVPVAASDVRPKLLTITANNRSKAFGANLVLGAGQTGFTSSGLVPGQSIGTVTLASPGAASSAAAGTYAITPSAATGGSFDPNNYDIAYLDGVLTVTAPTLSDWMAGYNVGSLTGFGDDPDFDGVPNALENLMGTAPDVASAGMTAVSGGGNTLVFRHTRTKTLATDLTVDYQWSMDAVNWYGSGATAEGVTVSIASAVVVNNPAPANDVVEVTASITGSAPRVFVRLRAVR